MDRLMRFASIVRARRQILGMTQPDVAVAGGPATMTVSKIENGVDTPLTPRTLKKLDLALRWVSGSAARAYAGGDPTPIDEGAGDQGAAFAKLQENTGIRSAAFRMADLESDDLATVNDLLRHLRRMRGLPEDP